VVGSGAPSRALAAGAEPPAPRLSAPFRFGPRSLFGWYDAPQPGGPRRPCAVLLCNPTGDDAVRAHRPLRHLAARLAASGFAVLRFDFHGTGDSPGDERQPDRVSTWLEDVRLAVTELRARSGEETIAVVGLRLGGTLAMLAEAEGVESLVLWGPYARGAAYHAESTRLYKMHRMLERQSFSGGPKARADGEEAFGFLLTHATIASLRTLDVASLERPPASRALIVGDGSGAPAEQEIVDKLGALGVAVERRVLAGSRQFLLEVPHKSRLPDDALDAILGWLSDAHPLQPVTRAPPPPSPGASSREEPIFFGIRHRLFGILHEGTSRELPPILLTSAGTVHRIGPHRFYVSLARRWASLGFPVLRVDLSGIGDTPAADDGVENVTYPRDGYEDLSAAMDRLSARAGPEGSASRFILAGLCSGGDFAFQMGMRDPRVVGALILNPRTFCVNDLAAVETGNFASVLAAADGVASRAGADVEAPVPESLRRMVGRGVDTLLVVSEKDPGVDYVDTQWGDAMRALQGLPGFRREDIPGTDHNFTSLWSQETVSDLCTEHLTRRYLT